MCLHFVTRALINIGADQPSLGVFFTSGTLLVNSGEELQDEEGRVGRHRRNACSRNDRAC